MEQPIVEDGMIRFFHMTPEQLQAAHKAAAPATTKPTKTVAFSPHMSVEIADFIIHGGERK